jgi:hypothetical protein
VSVNSRRLQTSNASIMENETTSKQATTQNKTSEKERADSNNKQHQVIIGTLAQLASKCQHTTKGCQHIPLRRLCSGPARDALDCLILPKPDVGDNSIKGDMARMGWWMQGKVRLLLLAGNNPSIRFVALRG